MRMERWATLSWPLSLEEGPDHCRSVRFAGRRALDSWIAPIWLREDMATAMDGNELHLHSGVVAPEYLLDMNSVGHSGLFRFRRAGDVVEVREILAGLARRPDLAAPHEQAEELHLSTIERVQGILRTVHDHDGGTALP